MRIYIASGTDEEDVRREAALLGIAEFAEEIMALPHRRKDCSKRRSYGESSKTAGCTDVNCWIAGDGRDGNLS